jgi:hypothetical protein
MILEAQGMCPDRLMGNVPHAEGVSTRERCLIPGAHWIIFSHISERLLLGPVEALVETFIG